MTYGSLSSGMKAAADWDGIEYCDSETHKGVVYIFKPNSSEDVHNIILQGLEAGQMYHLTFEDGTNPSISLLGSQLMSTGVDVTLYGTNVSELMFIEAPEPNSTVMLSIAGLIVAGWAGCRCRRPKGCH